MKFLVTMLMLSLMAFGVSCNRDNDSIMEREEAPLDRASDEIGHEADEVGDDLEDASEELDD